MGPAKRKKKTVINENVRRPLYLLKNTLSHLPVTQMGAFYTITNIYLARKKGS